MVLSTHLAELGAYTNGRAHKSVILRRPEPLAEHSCRHKNRSFARCFRGQQTVVKGFIDE